MIKKANILPLDPCEEMTGTYSGGITISYRDDRLVGEWNVINRLDFYGDVDQDCFGTMTFPDDRSYNFEYDFSGCILYWNGRNSNNKWKKDVCPTSWVSSAPLLTQLLWIFFRKTESFLHILPFYWFFFSFRVYTHVFFRMILFILILFCQCCYQYYNYGSWWATSSLKNISICIQSKW